MAKTLVGGWPSETQSWMNKTAQQIFVSFAIPPFSTVTQKTLPNHQPQNTQPETSDEGTSIFSKPLKPSDQGGHHHHHHHHQEGSCHINKKDSAGKIYWNT